MGFDAKWAEVELTAFALHHVPSPYAVALPAPGRGVSEFFIERSNTALTGETLRTELCFLRIDIPQRIRHRFSTQGRVGFIREGEMDDPWLRFGESPLVLLGCRLRPYPGCLVCSFDSPSTWLV
jgi:hypothetical protein